MFRSHLLRTMVCLLLVCCLLISVSPLKAEAVDPITATYVGIELIAGISAIIIGLGILPGTTSTELKEFNWLVNDVINALSDDFKIFDASGNAFLKVLDFKNGTRYYADVSLIEEVLFSLIELRAFCVDSLVSNLSEETYTYIEPGYSQSTIADDVHILDSNFMASYLESGANGTGFVPSDFSNYGMYVSAGSGDVFYVFSTAPLSIYSGLADYKSIFVDCCDAYTFISCYDASEDIISFAKGYRCYGTCGYLRHEICGYSAGASDPSAKIYIGECDFSVYSLMPYGNLAEKLEDEAYNTWTETKIIQFPNQNPDEDDGNDGEESPDLPAFLPIGVLGSGNISDVSQESVQAGTAIIPSDSIITTDESIYVGDPDTDDVVDPVPDPSVDPDPDATEVPNPDATEVPDPDATEVPDGSGSEIETPDGTDIPSYDPDEVPDGVGGGVSPGSSESIIEWLKSIWEWIKALWSAIVNGVEAIIAWLQSIWQAIQNGFTGLKEWLASAAQSIIDAINDLWNKLVEWWQSCNGSIINAIQSAAEFLLNGINDLFVPDADFLSEKVNALRERFSFVDGIIGMGGAFVGAFTDFYTEPPIIYAELKNANNSYYWGERAIILDLRWYAEYKPTVDAILSSFLWLLFGWAVFRKVPGIISGASGLVSRISGSDFWDGD